MKPGIVIFLFVFSVCISCDTEQTDGDFPTECHRALVKFGKSNRIPGFAFALFDRTDTIYTGCFGKSNLGFEINEETLFSIQSISKNITALAVMKAVQDDMVDLDTPLSGYLPSFSVNSCFESHPEEKITLRMLLSHTAGFTHEAPVGNNFDFSPCTTEEHVKSIQETWLKHPVGTAYSYSNLGFDLAAYILAQEAGMDFDSYLKSELFLPLGMGSTTSNDLELSQNSNRSDGHIPHVKSRHYSIPLPGSGAVYTNLSDFITYTRLLMNYGLAESGPFIGKQAMLEMFTIVDHHYGLGTYLDKSEGRIFINHNGGGFGYAATLVWFPEYEMGSVLLSNKYCNTFDVCISLMNMYIQEIKLEKNTEISELFTDLNGQDFRGKEQLPVSERSCDCEALFQPEWEKYLGEYSIDISGIKLKWYVKLANALGMGKQKFWIENEGQTLSCRGFTGTSVLKEYEPGLFFTDDFEVLDFRSEKVTFRNISCSKKKGWEMPGIFSEREQ